MKKPHAPNVRALLRQHPDGLPIGEISKALGLTIKVLNRTLNAMPDTYIDRWFLSPKSRGQYQGVWCVVVPPPHCPYPTDRFKPATRWAHPINWSAM